MTKCPHCKEEQLNTRFCSNCGGSLQAAPICPSCGNQETYQDAAFCSKCGTRLAKPAVQPAVSTSGKIICPHCGAVLSDRARFCNSCGFPRTQTAPLDSPSLRSSIAVMRERQGSLLPPWLWFWLIA